LTNPKAIARNQCYPLMDQQGFPSILVAHARRRMGLVLSEARAGARSDIRASELDPDPRQKELILGTLGMGAANMDAKSALEHLLSMDRGRMDLLMRNWISSLWASRRWREIPEFERARKHLLSLIRQPTRIEKLNSLLDPSATTQDQKEMLASLLNHPPHVLTMDGLISLQKRLSAADGIDMQNSRDLWKSASQGAMMLSDIIHASRFGHKHGYSKDELAFLSKVFGEDVERWDPEQYASKLRDAVGRKINNGRYDPILLSAVSSAGCGFSSLLHSARRQSEFNTQPPVRYFTFRLDYSF